MTVVLGQMGRSAVFEQLNPESDFDIRGAFEGGGARWGQKAGVAGFEGYSKGCQDAAFAPLAAAQSVPRSGKLSGQCGSHFDFDFPLRPWSVVAGIRAIRWTVTPRTQVGSRLRSGSSYRVGTMICAFQRSHLPRHAAIDLQKPGFAPN